MSEVLTTLSGYVAADPRLFVSANGTSFTTFRMATTRRFFDRTTGRWNDGQTLWFTVKTWRETARNVAESLRKGDAVVATGVVGVDEWDGPDGPRTSFVLEARSLGPDLARGVARFAPVVHRSGDGGRGSGQGAAERGSRDEPADAALDPWTTGLAELTSGASGAAGAGEGAAAEGGEGGGVAGEGGDGEGAAVPAADAPDAADAAAAEHVEASGGTPDAAAVVTPSPDAAGGRARRSGRDREAATA